MKGGGKRERASGKASNGPTGASEGSSSRSERRAASTDSTTVEMARQLAAIVETHALSELVVDTPELTLTLRRGPSWDAASAGATAHLHAAPPPSPMASPPAQPSGSRPGESHAPASTGNAVPAPSGKPEPDYHVVTSPFVGTFYRSPSPDADPYVVEGQRIEKGQVLCIVEAMKLMNEIEADTAGVVVAVMVENTQPVEYGQPLFRLAPP